jgi:hypothetical protein
MGEMMGVKQLWRTPQDTAVAGMVNLIQQRPLFRNPACHTCNYPSNIKGEM